MKAIANARVAIYGLGGSGCPIALQLAYLGVENLHLIDPDTVELSNLNRQVLYHHEDVGKLKVDAARIRLLQVNANLEISTYHRHNEEDLQSLIPTYEVVIDSSDDYRFKVMLDRICRQLRVSMIHTSAVALRGTVATFTGSAPGYEATFALPSLGRNLDEVSDDEFNSRRRALTHKLCASLYPSEVLSKVEEGFIPWQTLVPAPVIASGIAVAEIVRLLLGQKPHFGPTSVFEFDLAVPTFGFENYVDRKT